MILQKIVADCRWILHRDPASITKWNMFSDYFINLSQPKNLNWSDPNNAVISYRREFEELCIFLMSHGITEPQEMSVFRFITACKHFEKVTKPTKKI